MQPGLSNKSKIYFFTCPEADNYQDDIIPLAEGLQELEIPFYALNNYWLQSEKDNDYLFKATPDVHFSECDIVIFPYTWFNWVTLDKPPLRKDFPDGLFKPDRKYKTVYFDFNDGYETISWEPEFRKFDYIFRCKLNRKMKHPLNMIPWALGFSNRVISETKNYLTPLEKKHAFLSNLGTSHPYEHQLRRKMRLEFLPILKSRFEVDETRDNLNIEPVSLYDHIMWKQTNKRHNKDYYKRLNENLFTLSFCGEMADPIPFDAKGLYIGGGKKLILKRKFYKLISALTGKTNLRLIQWDSWRFWEALTAGSIPIHVDLEKYGVDLPIMPENYKHYIGIDLDNISYTFDFLESNRNELIKIAQQGRQWAFDYYSPKAVATRFLNHLQ